MFISSQFLKTFFAVSESPQKNLAVNCSFYMGETAMSIQKASILLFHRLLICSFVIHYTYFFVPVPWKNSHHPLLPCFMFEKFVVDPI